MCSSTVRRMEWVPNNCKVSSFSATRFCKLLGSRRILLIGDSTMHQTASVLMNAIYYALRDKGCQPQLQFSLSDTLVDVPGVPERGLHWMKYVVKYKPDIVILSTGPHIHNRDAFSTIIQLIKQDIVKHHAGVSFLLSKPFDVVWRTQPASGCAARAGERITDWSKYSWSKVYNYADQDERDEYARTQFENIVDVSPLRWRGDAHVGVHSKVYRSDCTHQCIPGPLSTLIPKLMLRYLEKMHARGGDGDDVAYYRRRQSRNTLVADDGAGVLLRKQSKQMLLRAQEGRDTN